MVWRLKKITSVCGKVKIPCTILWDIFRASLPNVEKFSGGSIFWQQKTGGNLDWGITSFHTSIVGRVRLG